MEKEQDKKINHGSMGGQKRRIHLAFWLLLVLGELQIIA